MDLHCCREFETCAGDPGCHGITECEVACGSSGVACRSACAERYFGSTLTAGERTDVAFCRASHCASDCGEPCGIDDYATGCAECLEQTCCTEWAALAASPEMASFAACKGKAGSEPFCDAPSPDAQTTWDAFSKCRDTCSSRCASGQAPADWSCLGKVVWPPPPPGRDRLDIHVQVTLGGAVPLPDIEVVTCPGANLVCVPPFPAGTTGPDGTATIQAQLKTAIGSSFYVQLHDPKGAVDDQVEYRFPPPVHGPVFWRSGLAPPGIMQALADRLGPRYDIAKTHVHVVVQSCGGLTADGVVLSSPDAPSDAILFYGDEAWLPVTGQDRTSLASNGGFANLSAKQRLTIEAHVEKTGQLIARVPVSMLDGAMTIVSLSPSPDSTAP